MSEFVEIEMYRKLANDSICEVTRLKAENKKLKSLVRALQATLANADPEGQHAVPEVQGQKVRTVIIIDDTYLFHKQYKVVLDELGFTVIADASNGEFGSNLVLSLKPDLVLLDYEMPIMDGLETAKRIRDRGNIDSKIVVVSSTLSPERIDNLLKVGVNEFLAKPLEAERLQTVLKSMGF